MAASRAAMTKRVSWSGMSGDIEGWSREEPMGRVIAVKLLLLLAGCNSDQKQQIAACQLEAIRIYPNGELYVGSKVEAYIITCMASHGYEWDIGDKQCHVENSMATNPHCYAKRLL
jgi:hypothetical protein